MSQIVAEQILQRLAASGISLRGASADSRGIAPGDVFLAYPGSRADGRRHIGDAVARGAAAVLWERGDGGVPQGSITVPNEGVEGLQRLAGYIGHRVYGRPSEALWMVGVTGTNGKTSVSQWIAHGLSAAGRRCAVIGTLGNGFPGALTDSPNTTPEALALHRDLARYRDAGAQAVAMEVSSIGLDQGRVNGIAFDVAVFTNLSRDHLDYHGSMEAYAAAKARLFVERGLKFAVLNLDDAYGRELARRLRGSDVQRVGYITQPALVGADVDLLLAAKRVVATAGGLRFTASTPWGEVHAEAPLVGRFNVSNLLAVTAVLGVSGVRAADVEALIEQLSPPPGRMQMLGGRGEPLVIVDYAHTPDALEQALTALRDTAQARGGRLVCVFGCGGDRDPGKRPLMGAAAARLADKLIVTSDNPRSENPDAIIADVVAGTGCDAAIVSDRAAAIAGAVSGAAAEDVVLIAGKGHEPYQEIQGRRLPFSDVEQAAAALARRGAQP